MYQKDNFKKGSISTGEWKKVIARLKKYKQSLKVRSDLIEAFKQVEDIRNSKAEKQTLSELSSKTRRLQ